MRTRGRPQPPTAAPIGVDLGRQALLDDGRAAPKNEPPVAILVETPDPDGRRWQAALELLLEAGEMEIDES
jgi:hypothetical protein